MDVRPSPIAGQWYPGDARTLGDEVDRHLTAAGAVTADGAVVALIAPHAGHRYSGAVARHAFAAARWLAPEVVAVVGPMHYPPARALRGHAALLVASTDLSHYHPQAIANRLDRELLRRVEGFDPDAVLRAQEEGAGEACGIGALAAVLWAARELGADRARVLDYMTSGDVTGDMDRVVGYAAGVVTRSAA